MPLGQMISVANLVRNVASVVVALYVIFATVWLLHGRDRTAALSIAVVLGVIAAASWTSLRDVVDGVYLRAARAFAIGDRVQVGGLQGRIQRLGYRFVQIETTDGELAMLPYRAIAGQAILRSPGVDRTSFHVFRVRLPAGVSIADARQTIRETALLCHWSSIAREPQVVAGDEGALEVTVFAVHADRAPDIEHALRRALGV